MASSDREILDDSEHHEVNQNNQTDESLPPPRSHEKFRTKTICYLQHLKTNEMKVLEDIQKMKQEKQEMLRFICKIELENQKLRQTLQTIPKQISAIKECDDFITQAIHKCIDVTQEKQAHSEIVSTTTTTSTPDANTTETTSSKPNPCTTSSNFCSISKSPCSERAKKLAHCERSYECNEAQKMELPTCPQYISANLSTCPSLPPNYTPSPECLAKLKRQREEMATKESKETLVSTLPSITPTTTTTSPTLHHDDNIEETNIDENYDPCNYISELSPSEKIVCQKILRKIQERCTKSNTQNSVNKQNCESSGKLPCILAHPSATLTPIDSERVLVCFPVQSSLTPCDKIDNRMEVGCKESMTSHDTLSDYGDMSKLALNSNSDGEEGNNEISTDLQIS